MGAGATKARVPSRESDTLLEVESCQSLSESVSVLQEYKSAARYPKGRDLSFSVSESTLSSDEKVTAYLARGEHVNRRTDHSDCITNGYRTGPAITEAEKRWERYGKDRSRKTADDFNSFQKREMFLEDLENNHASLSDASYKCNTKNQNTADKGHCDIITIETNVELDKLTNEASQCVSDNTFINHNSDHVFAGGNIQPQPPTKQFQYEQRREFPSTSAMQTKEDAWQKPKLGGIINENSTFISTSGLKPLRTHGIGGIGVINQLQDQGFLGHQQGFIDVESKLILGELRHSGLLEQRPGGTQYTLSFGEPKRKPPPRLARLPKPDFEKDLAADEAARKLKEKQLKALKVLEEQDRSRLEKIEKHRERIKSARSRKMQMADEFGQSGTSVATSGSRSGVTDATRLKIRMLDIDLL